MSWHTTANSRHKGSANGFISYTGPAQSGHNRAARRSPTGPQPHPTPRPACARRPRQQALPRHTDGRPGQQRHSWTLAATSAACMPTCPRAGQMPRHWRGGCGPRQRPRQQKAAHPKQPPVAGHTGATQEAVHQKTVNISVSLTADFSLSFAQHMRTAEPSFSSLVGTSHKLRGASMTLAHKVGVMFQLHSKS